MNIAARVSFLLLSLLAACESFATVGVLETLDGKVPSEPSAHDAGEEMGEVLVIQACGPDNAAGLDEAEVAALRAGGPRPDAARILYPYEGTVFPRGLAAPTLMWEGTPSGPIRLSARSKGVRYEGCLMPDAGGQLTLPDTLWQAVERLSQGAEDPLALELTTLADRRASGPLRVSFVLSPEAIQGTLYYSSYGSPSAGALNLAAVMRLPLGGSASPFVAPSGTCAGCHAASADGSTLLLANSGMGQAYRVSASLAAAPSPFQRQVTGAEYAAIDPTGSLYVTGATAVGGTGPLRMAPGSPSALLLSLSDGSVSLTSGLPEKAITPAFSPDGAWLAFNDATDSAGHVLAAMSFAAGQRTLSAYRTLFSDDLLFPAWPSFRPDSQQVVFALGERADFSANGTLIGSNPGPGPRSDLYLTELEGTKSTMLFRAMGFDSSSDALDDVTYLPFGAEDLHQNYYPSVLPTRTEKYDWVFFDSVRHYGNRGVVRGIWCAALDAGQLTGDPSHPPFYVPGQESEPPNLRPVAVKTLASEKRQK